MNETEARACIDERAEKIHENPELFLEALMAIDFEFVREREDFIVATLYQLFESDPNPEIIPLLSNALNRVSLYLKSVDTEFIEKMISYSLKHDESNAYILLKHTAHLLWFWKIGSAELINHVSSHLAGNSPRIVGALIELLGIIVSSNPYLSYLVYPIMEKYIDTGEEIVRIEIIRSLGKLGSTNNVAGKRVGEIFLSRINGNWTKKEELELVRAFWALKLEEKRIVEEGEIKKIDLISPAVNFLIEKLKSEDENIRIAAARALLSRVYEDKRGSITRRLILPALSEYLLNAKGKELEILLEIFAEIHNVFPLPWRAVKSILTLKPPRDRTKVKRVNVLLRVATRTPHLLNTVLNTLLNEEMSTREKEELLNFMTESPYHSKRAYQRILQHFGKNIFDERYLVQQAYIEFALSVAKREYETFLNYGKEPLDKLMLESGSEVIRELVIRGYGELFTKRKELYPVLLEGIIKELNRKTDLISVIIPLLPYFAKDPKTPMILEALMNRLDDARKKALRGIDLISAHSPELVYPYLPKLIEIYYTTGRREEILEISLILRNCKDGVLEYVEQEEDLEKLNKFRETLETVNFEGIGEILAKIEAKLGI